MTKHHVTLGGVDEWTGKPQGRRLQPDALTAEEREQVAGAVARYEALTVDQLRPLSVTLVCGVTVHFEA